MTTYVPPGLAEHLVHKGRAMRQAALDRPHPEDWDEQLQALCVADDSTGVRKLRIRDWSYIGDGGPAIGGTDLGPSSPELLLGVIATCFTHTLTCLAAMDGVPLDRVEVRVTAANNDANFFGVPSDRGWVPTQLAIKADVTSAAAESDTVAALVRRADETCPVLRLLRGQTPVAVELVEMGTAR